MLRISITDCRVTVSGRRLPLTPKFFQLFCLLALDRAQGRRRFHSIREIHRLPLWGRESLASIGKEVARQARQLRAAGWNLLESPPRKATHLVRLHERVSRVTFDRPLAEVRTWLGLDLMAPEASPGDPRRALEVTTALAQARMAFERGGLQETRAALARVDRANSTSPRDRVHGLLWWSRVLEREGRYAQAAVRAHEAETLCGDGEVDYLTCARVQIWLGHLGWLSRRPELLAAAHEHYRRAQALLGEARHFTELAQIATGLGHLARRERDWASAASYFHAALRYASADGWAWGIQAALCNLGLVCVEQADHVQDRASRQALYREACAWEERCVRFSDETGVGHDSTEAVSLLAEILLKLRRPKQARHWAQVALDRAQAAGNPKSQALALESLGQAWRALGQNAEARRCWHRAQTIYVELGREEDAARVRALGASGP